MVNTMFADLIQLEGGFADLPGDRGGPTFMGISSRSYPELRERILDRDLHPSEVRDIYMVDYYSQISGYRWLESNMPDLMFLLFEGKVHGAGINHVTELVQRWLISEGIQITVDGYWGPSTLSKVRALSLDQRDDLMRAIYHSVDSLASRRMASVGVSSLDESIRNRVLRAHDLAAKQSGKVANSLGPDPVLRLAGGGWSLISIGHNNIWVKA